jgi:hypothetical protein
MAGKEVIMYFPDGSKTVYIARFKFALREASYHRRFSRVYAFPDKVGVYAVLPKKGEIEYVMLSKYKVGRVEPASYECQAFKFLGKTLDGKAWKVDIPCLIYHYQHSGGNLCESISIWKSSNSIDEHLVKMKHEAQIAARDKYDRELKERQKLEDEEWAKRPRQPPASCHPFVSGLSRMPRGTFDEEVEFRQQVYYLDAIQGNRGPIEYGHVASHYSPHYLELDRSR